MALRLVHAQETIIKRYKIGFPGALVLGGSEGSKVVEAELDVTWDERKTVFQQAILFFQAHGRNDGWPIFPRSVDARLWVNDNLVGARRWPGANPACSTQTIDVNIGAYFINGRNRFKLEVVGSWGPFPAGIDAITADLEAQWTGEEPAVKPPPPEWWPIVKWGAIGFGAIAFVGLVVVPLIKKRS